MDGMDDDHRSVVMNASSENEQKEVMELLLGQQVGLDIDFIKIMKI